MVYQNSNNDCGKAVVRQMLTILYSEDKYSVIPLKRECSDFLQIRDELLDNGIEFLPFEIKSLDSLRKEELPAIAQIRRGDSYHFVIVSKIGRYVLITDPQFGDMSLTRKEFTRDFTGKILLKKTVGKRPAKPDIRLIRRKFILLYVLSFFFQLALSYLALFFLGQEEGMFFALIFLALYLVSLGLFMLLNMRVRRKLDDDVFLPYMNMTRNKEDMRHLSAILDLEVKKYSSIVSYGVLLVLFLVALSFNGVFYTAIAIVGLVFSLADNILVPERNKTNLICSLKENEYGNKLVSTNADQSGIFRESRARAQRYLFLSFVITASEFLILATLILSYMFAEGEFGLSFFLFSLAVAFGIRKVSSSLMKTYVDDSLQVREINSLSMPLSSFLLKRHLAIGYNTKQDGGVLDGSKTDTRLS